MRRAYLSVISMGLLAIVSMASWGPPPAVAQVRRVEILGREAPALGGRSFVDVGPYKKIEGRIRGEVDPGDPRNRMITDLGLAPRNAAGKDYAILVSAADGDGNEVAGVQPVGNRAPLGTNLPYNYDADPEVRDLAGLLGAFIPFHRTKAGRVAAGDGRPALEERYGTHAGYAAAVRDAADALLQAGYLRPDDRDRIVAAAEAGDVLR